MLTNLLHTGTAGCCLRHIGDFTRWKEHDAYQKALDRLLRDLRVEKAYTLYMAPRTVSAVDSPSCPSL